MSTAADRVPNRERGEVALTLDGVACILAPTFGALVAIEERTGAGVVMLARRLASMDVRATDLTAILTEGLRAAGQPAEYPRVGEMLLRHGLLADDVLRAVNDFLDYALTGGKEQPQGKAPAADAE